MPFLFPEGLAPADSLNDPTADGNAHELTPSAVTSAVARLASTFSPAPALTAGPIKIQTATSSEGTNGIATTTSVRCTSLIINEYTILVNKSEKKILTRSNNMLT